MVLSSERLALERVKVSLKFDALYIKNKTSIILGVPNRQNLRRLDRQVEYNGIK